MKWPWTKVKVRDSVIIFVEFITWISPISERVFFNTQTRVHTHRLFYLKMEYTKRSRHTHTRKKIAPKIRSISFGKLKHTLRWMCLWTTTEIIIYYSNNHRRYTSHHKSILAMSKRPISNRTCFISLLVCGPMVAFCFPFPALLSKS